MDLRIYGFIYDDNDTMSALPWFHLCSEGPHAAVCVVATVGQYVQHSRYTCHINHLIGCLKRCSCYVTFQIFVLKNSSLYMQIEQVLLCIVMGSFFSRGGVGVGGGGYVRGRVFPPPFSVFVFLNEPMSPHPGLSARPAGLFPGTVARRRPLGGRPGASSKSHDIQAVGATHKISTLKSD